MKELTMVKHSHQLYVIVSICSCIWSGDIVMAFVQRTLNKEICMEIPDTKSKDLVWIARKGLIDMGLFFCLNPILLIYPKDGIYCCAYIKINNKELVLVTIYVHDLLIFNNCIKLKNFVKEQLIK